jgi:hypothetical protein
LDRLAAKSDAELDMLDTLPSSNATNSRLACQIKINEQLQNSFIKLSAGKLTQSHCPGIISAWRIHLFFRTG